MNCKDKALLYQWGRSIYRTGRDETGHHQQAKEICGQTVTESLACNISRGAVVDGWALVTGCCLQEKRSVNVKEHEISI